MRIRSPVGTVLNGIYGVRASNNPFGVDVLYPVPDFITNSNVASPLIDNLHAIPFVARRTGIINQLSTRVTVAGGAGSKYRIGLYNADQDECYPPAGQTSLLFAGAEQDGTIAQTVNLACSVPVVKGQLYCAVYLAGVAAPQVIATLAGGSAGNIYGTDIASANTFMAARLAFPYAALPTIWPAGVATILGGSNVPILFVRYA